MEKTTKERRLMQKETNRLKKTGEKMKVTE
jgi:hypothetical protein